MVKYFFINSKCFRNLKLTKNWVFLYKFHLTILQYLNQYMDNYYKLLGKIQQHRLAKLPLLHNSNINNFYYIYLCIY